MSDDNTETDSTHYKSEDSLCNTTTNKTNKNDKNKKNNCKKTTKLAFRMTDNICCGSQNSLRLSGTLGQVYSSRQPVALCQRYYAHSPY